MTESESESDLKKKITSVPIPNLFFLQQLLLND